MRQSNLYILLFTLATTVFVGGTLAVTSIVLRPWQERSIEWNTKSQILSAIRQLDKDDDVLRIYKQRIRGLVVDYQGDEVTQDKKGNPVIADRVNVAKNYKLPPKERLFPIFKYMSDSSSHAEVDAYIIPVYGNGLWNRIWGFIALDNSLETIKGVSFGHAQETPGLGARISEDPEVPKRYKGKKIYAPDGKLVSVSMIKGEKGEPLDDYHVDGMSGATMTANGVNDMLKSYLAYYQAYFKRIKSQQAMALPKSAIEDFK